MPFGRKCITGIFDRSRWFVTLDLGLQCLSAVSALLGQYYVRDIYGVPRESPMPFGRKCITGPCGRPERLHPDPRVSNAFRP